MRNYLFIVMLLLAGRVYGQDSVKAQIPESFNEKINNSIIENASNYLDVISTKYVKINKNIENKNLQYLKTIQKEDELIRQRLQMIFSKKEKVLYAGIAEKYKFFHNKMERLASPNKNVANGNIARLDSIEVAIDFIKMNALETPGYAWGRIQKMEALSKQIQTFQSRLQQSNDLLSFLFGRIESLKLVLENAGLNKNLVRLQKLAVEYQQQIIAYKIMVTSFEEDENKVVEILNTSAEFQKYMQTRLITLRSKEMLMIHQQINRAPQHIQTKNSSGNWYYLSDTNEIQELHPNLIFVGIKRNACKSFLYIYLDTNHSAQILTSNSIRTPKSLVFPVQPVKNPFLKIHGNIYYNVFYQSNVDTPYLEQDLYQHTIRTYLDVTVKNQYPLKVNFTTRFSNSSVFKDFSGLGFQFNTQSFKNTIRANLENWALQQLSQKVSLDKLKDLLERKKNELATLGSWINGPSTAQRLIEERERAFLKGKQIIDTSAYSIVNNPITMDVDDLDQIAVSKYSINSGKRQAWYSYLNASKDSLFSKADFDSAKVNKYDSIFTSFEAVYENNKRKYDSLSKEVSGLQQKYEEDKTAYNNIRTQLAGDLTQIKDVNKLAEKLKTLQLPDTLLPKGYKTLLAIKSFGIGRTMLDYSELSVKNINITGLQVEYNPSWYIAVASGVVDYRFRDFIVNDGGRPKQYLNIVRVGKGIKEGNNVIFTFYGGKKQLYNYYVSSTVNNPNQPSPNYHLTGFTIETRRQLDANNYVILEVGKSSLPYYLLNTNKQSLIGSTFLFKNRSNEAYSIKLASYIPATRTKVTGFYKHMGANFQSFTLFTTNATQSAWSIKAEQPLFKHKLNIVGAIRKNDFSNPYLANSFQSNTVFKSIQATMRIKKMPIVSVGYFPSSQLTKLNDSQFVENLFYTFVGTVSHYYKYRGTQMNTLISYTQFYNKQTDSNFVYFNTKNILISQFVFLSKCSLQLNISAASNTTYNLFGIGGNVQYQARKWVSIGGGLKYNRQTVISNEQTGFNLNATIKVPKLGEFQFFGEKGFLPGINRQLVQNNVGRFTYYKNF
ncbi:hypothetical protein [Limnovirga soli]|uniref:Uncharacterized protein n=1 Tax=Limnovirga soli TaxID=2656915 RepID=A0A8J8JSR5_9BACT|nr:hypothetical protein [Limnovirga soli]NNV55038.1 hypothetical protein [Limnovirga soli]